MCARTCCSFLTDVSRVTVECRLYEEQESSRERGRERAASFFFFLCLDRTAAVHAALAVLEQTIVVEESKCEEILIPDNYFNTHILRTYANNTYFLLL
jgi:hypothetical protein